MRAFGFALALTALFTSALADVYKVQHRRPSAILANLIMAPAGSRIYTLTGGGALSLLPAGVTLTADDAKSTITIDGPASYMVEAKKILDEFDVAIRQVSARITIRSKVDKYESTTVTQLSNNTGWTFEDNASGVKLKVTPRINGDGTITGSFMVLADKNAISFVTRTKVKEALVFGITNGGLTESVAQLLLDPKLGIKAKHDEPSIFITVTFEAVVIQNAG